jgi:hypothetical protein
MMTMNNPMILCDVHVVRSFENIEQEKEVWYTCICELLISKLRSVRISVCIYALLTVD